MRFELFELFSMNKNKRARICRASTEEFLILLQKEHAILLEKDVFKANILARILNFTPLDLEEVLIYLYRYEIDLVLRETARKTARKALEYYDQPDFEFRGADTFREIYDDLKEIYGVDRSE
jgi:hypothetical protein